MQDKNTQILTGNLRRVALEYIALNVLSMLGLSLYIMADTYFVANGVGNDGLVALNLVIPAYNVINGLGLLLGVGGATCYSIRIGAGETDTAPEFFTLSTAVGLFTGILLTLTGVFFSRPIAALLGGEGPILDLASDYLRIMLLFSCAFILNQVLVCFVRNDGAPNLAMAAMLAGSASNIVLDYLFIFPLGMGMTGAALATGSAPIISALILLPRLMGSRSHLRICKVREALSSFKRVLHAGVPSLITEASTGIVILLFNATILRISSQIAVGAYGIITNFSLVGAAIFTGVAQGIQPVISVCHGAGKSRRIRQTFGLAAVIVLLLSSAFVTLGILFRDPLTALFNRENDPEMARIARQGFALYFPAFVPMGLNIIAVSLTACIQKPKWAFLLSCLRGFAAVIPLLLLLSMFFGLDGVFATVTAAEALTLCVTLIVLRIALRPSTNYGQI